MVIKTDWKAMRDLVHQTAIEHGWHESKRSFSEYACLFHCELSEAVEELRKGQGHEHYYGENGKPEGYYVELTDCIIRILDWMGEEDILPENITIPMQESEITEIARAHFYVSEAWNLIEQRLSGLTYMSALLCVLTGILESHGQNVEELIREKNEFNRGRSWKHGKVF